VFKEFISLNNINKIGKNLSLVSAISSRNNHAAFDWTICACWSNCSVDLVWINKVILELRLSDPCPNSVNIEWIEKAISDKLNVVFQVLVRCAWSLGASINQLLLDDSWLCISVFHDLPQLNRKTTTRLLITPNGIRSVSIV